MRDVASGPAYVGIDEKSQCLKFMACRLVLIPTNLHPQKLLMLRHVVTLWH